MLHEMMFNGKYLDEHLKVDIMLLNPAEYGFDENVLLFESIIFLKKDVSLSPGDFAFYILGKGNRLYNALNAINMPSDNSEGDICSCNGKRLKVLVAFQFNPELLYQDLRIGFLYAPYGRVEFIKLEY